MIMCRTCTAIAAHANLCEPVSEPPCVISIAALEDVHREPKPPDSAHTLPVMASCDTGCAPTHIWDLLQFVPWTSLQQPPADLDRPHRFNDWVARGTVGHRPDAAERLIVTTDGSFHQATGRAGWGLVISCQMLEVQTEPVFVGCAMGSVNAALVAAGEVWECPDAHLAESAWGHVGSNCRLSTQGPDYPLPLRAIVCLR